MPSLLALAGAFALKVGGRHVGLAGLLIAGLVTAFGWPRLSELYGDMITSRLGELADFIGEKAAAAEATLPSSVREQVSPAGWPDAPRFRLCSVRSCRRSRALPYCWQVEWAKRTLAEMPGVGGAKSGAD